MSSSGYEFVNGISGTSLENPSIRDPDCSTYRRNTCIVGNVTAALELCNKYSQCAGFIVWDSVVRENGICYLFADPFTVNESAKTGLVYNQNGYIKVGKIYTSAGVTKTAGVTSTPTSTIVSSPPRSSATPTSTSTATTSNTGPTSSSTSGPSSVGGSGVSANPKSSDPAIGIAVGAAVGVTAVLAVVAGLFFFYRRKKMGGKTAVPLSSLTAYPTHPSHPPSHYPTDLSAKSYNPIPLKSHYPESQMSPAMHPEGPAQYMPVVTVNNYMTRNDTYEKSGAPGGGGGGAGSGAGGGLFFSNTMANIPVFDWSPEIVANWVSSKGFPSYVGQTLSANEITGTRLLLLTDSKLQQMGITSLEVCHQLRTCVDQLREVSMESPSSGPSGGVSGGDVPPPYVPGGKDEAGMKKDSKSGMFKI
ncbi:hypothetical protein HDU67_008781 [Dinochytrium kinnereticum]|nr:hypothetical protein HDU67_008781 [Dinochytrium kinnereticum]